MQQLEGFLARLKAFFFSLFNFALGLIQKLTGGGERDKLAQAKKNDDIGKEESNEQLLEKGKVEKVDSEEEKVESEDDREKQEREERERIAREEAAKKEQERLAKEREERERLAREEAERQQKEQERLAKEKEEKERREREEQERLKKEKERREKEEQERLAKEKEEKERKEREDQEKLAKEKEERERKEKEEQERLKKEKEEQEQLEKEKAEQEKKEKEEQERLAKEKEEQERLKKEKEEQEKREKEEQERLAREKEERERKEREEQERVARDKEEQERKEREEQERKEKEEQERKDKEEQERKEREEQERKEKEEQERKDKEEQERKEREEQERKEKEEQERIEKEKKDAEASPSNPAGREFPPGMEAKRKQAIGELVESEVNYCEFLQSMMDYQTHLAKVIPPDQSKLIFANISPLVLLSQTFVKSFAVEQRKGTVQAEISTCFSNAKQFVKLMVPYIELYPKVSEVVTELSNGNKEFNKVCAKLEETHQPLSSLIVMPVQRIAKYPLLIKEILKATPEWHPDYAKLPLAMEEMKEASHNADLKVQDAARRDQIMDIQRSIKKCPNLIAANRTLVGIWPIEGSQEIIVMSDLALLVSVKKSKKSIVKTIDLNSISAVTEAPFGIFLAEKSTGQGITIKVEAKKDELVRALETEVRKLADLRQRLGK